MIADRYVLFILNIIFSFVSISFLTRVKFTDTGLFLGRVSITVVRTWSTAGDTGPTIVLLKGENKRPQFTDEFLEKHGLESGSTIVMTIDGNYQVIALFSPWEW